MQDFDFTILQILSVLQQRCSLVCNHISHFLNIDREQQRSGALGGTRKGEKKALRSPL